MSQSVSPLRGWPHGRCSRAARKGMGERSTCRARWRSRPVWHCSSTPGSTATLLRLAGAAVLLIGFLLIERRQRYPLMPFSIFRLRTLRGANIIGLLIGMSLFSMFFFISLYLQNVLHYSPIKAGLSYLPLSVGIILSAGAASQLVTRVGFKPPLIAGLLLIAGGLLWFAQVPSTGGSYAADVLGPSLL